MGRVLKIAGLICVGLFVVGAAQGNRTTALTASASAPVSVSGGFQSSPAVTPLKSYVAGDLASAYDANSVAADDKFKGKRYRVSGIIDNISTDLWGSAHVTMKGGVNMFLEPNFAFADSEKSRVAKLWKGAGVTLICTGTGDVVKTPMSNDCVIQ